MQGSDFRSFFLSRNFALLTAVGLFSLLISNATLAAGDESATTDAKALEATQELVDLARRHGLASVSVRAPIAADMVVLGQARQALLAELMTEDPGQALRLAFPTHVAERMPAEVQDLLEEWVTLEGELEVRYVDMEEPGESFVEHILTTPAGERFSLHFAKGMPAALTGTQVRASGLFLDAGEDNEADGLMALRSGEEDVELLACCEGPGSASSAAAAPVPNTFGEQAMLVLLVNFQDDPGNEPWTVQDARDLVLGTVSDFFFENSYQQTWLAGEALGWYTLGINSTCSTSAVEAAANEMAAAQGIDLSMYPRLVYMFPNNACSWAGQATVGGNPSKAFIVGSLDLRVVGHELGHNFGLYHSHGLNCIGAVVASDCDWVEYGDRLDIMGGRALHINAFQKERLGWLNYGASPSITTVVADGTFQLPPYEEGGLGPQALKIFRDIDPNLGQSRWYYLEHRQAIGFDAAMLDDAFLDTANVLDGVVFHLGTEGDDLAAATSSFLLDMTPDTSSHRFLDLDDPALVFGESYSDAEAGVTVTTDWVDISGAQVSVSFGASSCAPAAPELAVSPSESLWVEPLTLVSYSVTVTNRDNAACGTTRFDLLSSAPSGWTASFAGAALDLAPGESGTTTLDVVSPDSTADGFYDVTVTAENSTDPAFTASTAVTYVVSAPINSPPVAVDDSATTSPDQAVTVTVLANDWDPDGDPLSVIAATAGTAGTATVNADGTVTYWPNSKAKGRNSFTYSVSDGIQVSNALVTVSVKKQGGGKGKGKPSS